MIKFKLVGHDYIIDGSCDSSAQIASAAHWANQMPVFNGTMTKEQIFPAPRQQLHGDN